MREISGQALLRAANRLSVANQFVSIPADAFHERPPGGPLWGWGLPRHAGLEAMFQARSDAFRAALDIIDRYGPDLATIDRGHREDLEPCWTNPMFAGLDGASLYSFLRDRRPRRYVEIGSGYSTKFAARAKADGRLETEIVSIDPAPRADIDKICDQLVRAPLEETDQQPLRTLQSGDMVLLDGSHRLLMGNHLALFFVELLPSFPSGVLVGVHDIYLPDDYAPAHVDTYWNEQYLLAITLLAGTARYKVTLPCHYVGSTSPLQEELDSRWVASGLGGLNAWGCVLWFTVR
jgi:hypothetical protein